MKKLLAISFALVSVIGLHFATTAYAACTPVTVKFPSVLDTFHINDCVPSSLINGMESLIGITGSTDVNSLQYKINNVSSSPSVAGTNSQVQYNNAGTFGADSNLIYSPTTGLNVATATAGNLTITGACKGVGCGVGGIGNGVTGDCVKWGSSSTLVDALTPCASNSGPFNVNGPNGTSTIYGSASSSYVYVLNGNPQMPSPTMLAAGALCGITYPVYDGGQCFMAIQSYLGAAATYDFGPYTYNYSYPIIYSKYNMMKGHGQTLLSFTPSYYNVTSANSSTKVINYSSVGSPTYFSGEAVTAVGASLPSGVVIGKLYYVGSLTSTTLKLYSNSNLSSVVNITGTGTGTLETPAVAFDGGQNPSYGWGSDGISYNGPNNGSSTGLFIGGPNGARSLTISNGSITHFYYNIEGGDNSYFVTIQNIYDYRNAPNTNSLTYGGLFWMDASSNAGEEWNFSHSVFADAQPANNTLAISYAWDWQTSGFVDVECEGTSFDDAGRYFNTYDGEGNSAHDSNCHMENPGADGGGWGSYTFFTTPIGNPNTSIDIDWSQDTILNNANGGNTPPMVLNLGPGAMFNGNGVSVQNNSYVSASQIPLFATIAAGSYLTMTGFHNIGDTPGVHYMYNTRSPVAGYMTNAPSFFDGTIIGTAETTWFNNMQMPPTIKTTSSTLNSYDPNIEETSSSVPLTITFPSIVNNTGSWFDLPNIGSATTTILTSTSTDLFLFCPALTTATSGTISVGAGGRFLDDTKHWTQICY